LHLRCGIVSGTTREDWKFCSWPQPEEVQG
jgi:hypothetical protein